MAVSVILVTMVSMFLLGLGLLAQRQADAEGYWYDRIQVSIYLCTPNSSSPTARTGPSPTRRRPAIQRQLEALPEVKAVFLESEQEAFERFKEQFRNSPISGNVQVGDIPQSLRVQLTDPTKFEVSHPVRGPRGSPSSRTRRRSSASSSRSSTTSPCSR